MPSSKAFCYVSHVSGVDAWYSCLKLMQGALGTCRYALQLQNNVRVLPLPSLSVSDYY